MFQEARDIEQRLLEDLVARDRDEQISVYRSEHRERFFRIDRTHDVYQRDSVLREKFASHRTQIAWPRMWIRP